MNGRNKVSVPLAGVAAGTLAIMAGVIVSLTSGGSTDTRAQAAFGDLGKRAASKPATTPKPTAKTTAHPASKAPARQTPATARTSPAVQSTVRPTAPSATQPVNKPVQQMAGLPDAKYPAILTTIAYRERMQPASPTSSAPSTGGNVPEWKQAQAVGSTVNPFTAVASWIAGLFGRN